MKLIKKIINKLISNETYIPSKKETKKLILKGYIDEKTMFFTNKFFRDGITYILFINLDEKIRIGQQISNINSQADYFYISDKDFFFKLLNMKDIECLINYSV